MALNPRREETSPDQTTYWVIRRSTKRHKTARTPPGAGFESRPAHCNRPADNWIRVETFLRRGQRGSTTREQRLGRSARDRAQHLTPDSSSSLGVRARSRRNRTKAQRGLITCPRSRRRRSRRRCAIRRAGEWSVRVFDDRVDSVPGREREQRRCHHLLWSTTPMTRSHASTSVRLV
jgi:hypothetical protein